MPIPQIIRLTQATGEIMFNYHWNNVLPELTSCTALNITGLEIKLKFVVSNKEKPFTGKYCTFINKEYQHIIKMAEFHLERQVIIILVHEIVHSLGFLDHNKSFRNVMHYLGYSGKAQYYINIVEFKLMKIFYDLHDLNKELTNG